MNEHTAFRTLVGMAELVRVVPDPRLVENGPPEVRLVEDEGHGVLVGRPSQVVIRPEDGKADGLSQHADGPLVHAKEEDARVQTLSIFRADEMDVAVVTILGWKEDLDGDLGIDNDRVGIEPPVNRVQTFPSAPRVHFYRDTQNREQDLSIHQPLCSFFWCFTQLLNDN